MKEKKIAKSELTSFLDSLISEYKVFAPVKRDGFVAFQEIHSGSEALLDYANSKKPPKEIFLPQSEVLFTYRLGGEGLGIEEPSFEGKPMVIFGIRPCDARSLVILDNIFNSQEYKDVYYTNKREKTLVIAIGCNQPSSTCFCASLGGGPFSPEGSDLILIDIDEEYVVQPVTDKGERLVRKHSQFREVKPRGLSLMRKVTQKAEALIKSKVETGEVKKKLDRMFDDPFWDWLHEKCLGCAVCTYLCPTCHCFDIADEATDRGGRRVRIWDTCAFPLFTLEASGVNPRPTNKERMRQRVMHKFKHFVDNYNVAACVGCGRCIKECPVNLDIRAVLNSILNR
jgi:formate hydrogenlyase subunit 6/NADH:ubiquinone oxidoreductase subunit I